MSSGRTTVRPVASVPLLPVLTTNQKGAIAEAAIIKVALGRGWDVYRPAFEGGRYDLIFDMDGELGRIQCKWAPLHNEVIVIRSYSTRRARTGLVRRTYVDGDFDYLAAYSPDLDRCYLLPWSVIAGGSQLHLRLSRARNNQRSGVRVASDFEFTATLPQTRLGPIAQLGERRHGMAEVVGSSPTGSTG
jgi:PD-(D/E)XK nuclease superfamily protein